MKRENMTPDEIIEFLKGTSAPKFLLDKKRLETNSPPLTDGEKLEYAKYSINNYRGIIAGEYLLSCFERFGAGVTSTYAFRHENNIIALDDEVIKTLLAHQIEKVILERRPNDGYLALWQFYVSNDQHEKDTGEKWMQNFIDDVFIKGYQLLDSPTSGDLIH